MIGPEGPAIFGSVSVGKSVKKLSATLMAGVFWASGVWAQESGVWVQIEAQPTLGQAQERVADYVTRLDDVVGYALGSGWYAVALGPYAEDDALLLLRTLRGQRAIPGDSFIVDGGNFRQQFFPVGTGAALSPQDLPEGIGGTAEEAAPETLTDVAAPEITPEPEPEPEPEPDETPREAQASENALSRDEKRALQVALQWAGFYNSAIDGLFGRGTRASMAAWQEAKGYETTGILTTRQRAELIDDYNSVLDGMDLELVRDDTTGIEMLVPAGVVRFDAYAPPFARFEAKDELGAQVLLISQPGNQDRLFGLYEIMQTLEIVPPEGERERRRDGFTLEGVGGGIHSFTEVRLVDGEIKGFTLVWPEGDEERRSRVLAEMRASYQRIDGVLDPGLVTPGEEQGVDLVSGLAIRQPILTRSGFYLDQRGHVMTTARAVEECREITIDGAHEAQVAYLDADLGVAVLEPLSPLAPISIARFQTGVPRLQSQIAVAGYPFGAVLAAPALTFGTLADIRGLAGEEEIKRLEVSVRDGDAGGPVFDNGGAVIGMLAERSQNGGQILPDNVQFSIDSEALLAALGDAGVSVPTTDSMASITPEMLTRFAGQITVLVSCWD